MKTILVVLLSVLLVVLAADFLAGVVHWFEDAYVRDDTPIIGPIIGKANIIHHHFPRYFTRFNWWQSSWDLLLLSVALLFAAWRLDLLTWQVWLFAGLSANANQVHKWSHRTRKENGRVISFLQDIRLLQTPQHHAIHHTNPKNVHYCPITNLLNPLLDRLHFWAGVEWLLERTIGLRRRPDTSLPGHGPFPAWLKELREQTPCQRQRCPEHCSFSSNEASAAGNSCARRPAQSTHLQAAQSSGCGSPRLIVQR